MSEWLARQESWTKRASDARDDGDVDFARIVHSASFRRLQGKTQVLNLGESDFYRTRLTHSIEVAQVAAGLVVEFQNRYRGKELVSYLPGRSLIQAIGYTHDLGHPPFGHGGEVALNYCMRERGGFEGNGQTLRILSKLEKFSSSHGSNLTRRTLLGVLKYPCAYSDVMNDNLKPRLVRGTTAGSLLDREISKPPKCYLDSERDVVDWVLAPLSEADRDEFVQSDDVSKDGEPKHRKPRHKSFDCSIMDLADDISFGVHDLEDAIALGLISRRTFMELVPEESCSHLIDFFNHNYPGQLGNDVYEGWVSALFGDGGQRKHTINRMVGHLMQAAEVGVLEIFESPFLNYRARLPKLAREYLNRLVAANREAVIFSPGVQHLEFKGQNLVLAVFEALQSDPEKLLPLDTRQTYRAAGADGERVLCDHVAGMTDDFLVRTYARLFNPGAGSVFEKH